MTKLSDREQQIINLASQGLTTKEIATSLNKSVQTIGNQRSQILRKLQAKNMVEVMATFRIKK